MKKLSVFLASLMLVVMITSGASATPFLQDWGFNVDGESFYKDLGTPDAPPRLPSEIVPKYFDVSGFNFSSGFGTVKVDFSGTAGVHNIAALFDHDSTHDIFKEIGTQHGDEIAGQTWEIGKPIIYNTDNTISDYGLIYSHFGSNALTSSASPYGPNDVAMAINRQFTLAAGEHAILSFTVSDLLPLAGFYLEQYDPFFENSIYFTSSISIDGSGTPVPEPSTLILFGTALAGLGLFSRKRRNF